MGNGFLIHGDLLYALWMYVGASLLKKGFKEYKKSRNLYSASGAACAGTDEHKYYEDGF